MHGSQIIVLADGVRDMLATPTKANFSTACSDGTFLFVGDAPTAHEHEGADILSTGEGGGTKYLREDGDGTCSWQAVAGSGNVSNTGTPADNQIAVWTNATTVEGTSGLTYDGSELAVTGTLVTTSHQYMANSAILYCRNNADSAWIQAIQVFTDDALYIGQQNTKLYLRTDSAVQVTIDNDSVNCSDCDVTTTGTVTSRGGRSLTESTKTGSFVAADGYDYQIYLDTAAADVTVTFPTGATGARFRCTVVGDDLTNGYAVKYSLGSEKINSGTDDDPWWLFIEGDTVEFIYRNAVIGWVPSANIKPHACELRRDAAQTINDNTSTKVLVDAETFDNGGIGDITTNDRINIRRDGLYHVGGIVRFNVSDNDYVQIEIHKTGGGILLLDFVSCAGLSLAIAKLSTVIELAAGDYLELYVKHNYGSSRTTTTSVYDRPRIFAIEQR